jgi:hypothetical protein
MFMEWEVSYAPKQLWVNASDYLSNNIRLNQTSVSPVQIPLNVGLPPNLNKH